MIWFAIPHIKTSPNSEILCQRPSDPKSRTFCTLDFVPDGRFLVFHLFGKVLVVINLLFFYSKN